MDRVKWFCLGLDAPFVMVPERFLAIPDLLRYLRLRAMSSGTPSRA